MPKETRLGTPFTQHVVTTEPVVGEEEGFAEARRFGQDPWGYQANALSAIRDDYEAELARVGGDRSSWKPRVDNIWYLAEMVMMLDRTEKHTREGNASWAAHSAYQLGLMVAEFGLKIGRGDLYDKAHEDRERHQAAVSRKATDEARHKLVGEIAAERGNGITDACRVAAQRHPEMGGFHSFKSSYHKNQSKNRP